MTGKAGIERQFDRTQARPQDDVVDPADMGTAYGMELSIEDARKSAENAMPTGEKHVDPAKTPAAAPKPR
jgi:hypothetical protein